VVEYQVGILVVVGSIPTVGSNKESLFSMDFSSKIWSKVKLISGSPEMTITSIYKNVEGNDILICKWKDEQGNLCMSDFNAVEVVSL
jgi:uncharacterized protein YodC (DUF2158 family)